MFLNAACYIRVSTDEQTEYSPDAQLRLLKDFAGKNDICLADEHIYIDAGISGRKADKRPAFQKMITAAKAKPKPFDIILVHKFDRFARSREDSVVYKSLLKKEAGIKVVSITESIDDDKFSVILEAMLEAMAEYYSLNLSEEVMKGMTEKALSGGILTRAPYGYRNTGTGTTPEIIPDEAEAVKMMFEKIHSGEMTPYTLARRLNSMGITTRSGNSWSVSSLKYILRNPFYTGLSVWNRQQRSTGQYKDKSAWITARGKHEPLIEVKAFEEVQNILNKKPTTPKLIKTRQNHPLTGLLKCSACGSALSAHGKGRYPFFQCNGYNKGKCAVSHYAPIHTVEAAVSSTLKELFCNFSPGISYVPKPRSQKTTPNNETRLEENLKKAEAKLARVKAAYASGIDTLDEYREAKRIIKSEIEFVKLEIMALSKSSLSESNSTPPPFPPHISEIIDSAELSIDKKNKALKSFIEKIVFDKQHKTIEIFIISGESVHK